MTMKRKANSPLQRNSPSQVNPAVREHEDTKQEIKKLRKEIADLKV